MDFVECDNLIQAKNRGGKTTIADAYSWLITDKNYSGQKEFDLKPIDAKTEKVINHLETEVQGIFSLEGKDIMLRKKLVENWAKKRGNTESVLTGHTTEYFVDDMTVPIKKNEYQAFINKHMESEEVFRILSNPNYFNSMPWKERRDILFNQIDEIKFSDIVSFDDRFAELAQYQNINAQRDMMQKKLTALGKQIDEKPIQIAELQKALENIEIDLSSDELTKKLFEIRNAKNLKNDEVMAIVSNERNINVQLEVNSITMAISSLESEHKENYEICKRDTNKKIYDIQQKLNLIDNVLKNIDERNKLREEYNEVAQKEYDLSNVCPVCNQFFNENYIEKAVERFNESKKLELDTLNFKGKNLFSFYENLIAQCKELCIDTEDLYNKKIEFMLQVETLKEYFAVPMPNFEDSEVFNNLIQKREELLSKLVYTDEEIQKIDFLKQSLLEMSEEIQKLEVQISKAEFVEETKARIQRLKEEEKAIAKEYQENHRIISLIDDFNRKKCEIFTEKINKKFELVKWKLFENNINGSIDLVCECLFNGVPYSKTLNTESKLLAGLDCINTLSKYYNLSVPIFIDNRESVTNIIPVDAQVINFVVNPDYDLQAYFV